MAPDSDTTKGWRGWRGWLDRHRESWQFRLKIGGVLALFVLVYFFNRIFIVIPAGHEGVLFQPFFSGTRLQQVFPEGLHVIAPWNTMTMYEMRLQQRTETFVLLTVGGVPASLETSIRYRPISEHLPELHQQIGPEYFEKVIKPEVRAVLVRLAGEYTAAEIYSTKRRAMQELLTDGRPELSENGIDLDDLLILGVELPPTIKRAIEEKAAQEQLLLGYEFRLKRELNEAKRKKIEALGIQEFQEIIQDGISEQLLRWKGIEATLALAESQNAKVVVIGGAGGLPLILDTSDGGMPKAAAAVATPVPGANLDLDEDVNEKPKTIEEAR